MAETYYIKNITKTKNKQFFGYTITLSKVSLQDAGPHWTAGEIDIYWSNGRRFPVIADFTQKYVFGTTFKKFGMYLLEGETEWRREEDWYKLTGGRNSEFNYDVTLETSSWINARESSELHKKKIKMILERKDSSATLLEYWGEGEYVINGESNGAYVQKLLREILVWARYGDLSRVADGATFLQEGLRDMPHYNLRL